MSKRFANLLTFVEISSASSEGTEKLYAMKALTVAEQHQTPKKTY